MRDSFSDLVISNKTMLFIGTEAGNELFLTTNRLSQNIRDGQNIGTPSMLSLHTIPSSIQTAFFKAMNSALKLDNPIIFCNFKYYDICAIIGNIISHICDHLVIL